MTGKAARRDVDAPDLPRRLETLSDGHVDNRSVLEAVRADSSLDVATTVYDAVLKESVLEGVDLRERRLIGLRCTDVRFEGCDLAGAVLQDAVLTRVELVRCRMTGAVLSGAELQDVQLVDCSADLLALRMARASRLWVTGGSLREADLYQGSFESSRLIGCDLTGADFSGASVPELDLRASTLEGVISPSSLRGAVITTDQLVALAGSLAGEAGITVAAE